MSIYTKYPRTFHLPWSETIADDDKTLKDSTIFDGEIVVVSEKMDGENTTMYSDHIHARSIDSRHHSSRDWVKGFWSSIKFDIPKDYRICVENVYAQHSVVYDNLQSYCEGISVWKEDTCLSWLDTLEWFELLGIMPVTVFYIGVYDEKLIKMMWKKYSNESGQKSAIKEGYVIRLAESFHRDDFSKSVAKYVRKNHVPDDSEHWMHKQVIPNKLMR